MQVKVELIERFAFYERAKTAFAVVATGYVHMLYEKNMYISWTVHVLLIHTVKVHSMETSFLRREHFHQSRYC